MTNRLILCGQKDCKNQANYRYTWPGRDESFICLEHALKLEAVVTALGMHLQLIPLTDEEYYKLQRRP